MTNIKRTYFVENEVGDWLDFDATSLNQVIKSAGSRDDYLHAVGDNFHLANNKFELKTL